MKTKRLEILSRLKNNEITVEMADEELSKVAFTSSRYSKEKFTPPFRVGRKRKRVVLDAKGLEVAHFYFSDENMADDYVKWLNGY
jgi:DNA helicase TIP49 (TBP-interacting protein)